MKKSPNAIRQEHLFIRIDRLAKNIIKNGSPIFCSDIRVPHHQEDYIFLMIIYERWVRLFLRWKDLSSPIMIDEWGKSYISRRTVKSSSIISGARKKISQNESYLNIMN